jgi:hypothetical protein
VLKDYLEERTKEVHDIMFTLFDQDAVIKNHIAYESRIAAEKARNEGRDEGISDMVKKFLSCGTPMEYIVKASGWSEDQILALK